MATDDVKSKSFIELATGVNLPGIYIGRVIEGSGVKVLDMKKAPDSWRHFN